MTQFKVEIHFTNGEDHSEIAIFNAIQEAITKLNGSPFYLLTVHKENQNGNAAR